MSGLNSSTARAEADQDSQVVAAAELIVPASGEIRPTQAEYEDLASIAESAEITLDEAVRRYGWQQQFSDVVAMIREKFPESFSGSSMNDAGVDGAIEFSGSVPDGASDLVVNVPVEVHLVGSAPYSRAEVDQAVEAAHYSVYSTVKPGSVSTSFDDESGTIVAVLYATDDSSLKSGEYYVNAMERAVARDVEIEHEIPVNIQIAPSAGTGEDVIRGGALLGGSRMPAMFNI